VRQACLVCALQKSGAEDRVHLHGGVHDRPGYLIYMQGPRADLSSHS
jgi:hypothetical protein